MTPETSLRFGITATSNFNNVRDIPWNGVEAVRTQDRANIFESLSMAVDCENLEYKTYVTYDGDMYAHEFSDPDTLCAEIKDSYETFWGTLDNDYDHLSVKLADLDDVNGDGYLDRVISGNIVVWDPNALDQIDETGFRNPVDGATPCVYVSFYNPEQSGQDDAFGPFVRYDINGYEALGFTCLRQGLQFIS